MTQPQITPAGEDQPTSEAGPPSCGRQMAPLADEIAGTGERPPEAHETPGRRKNRSRSARDGTPGTPDLRIS